MQPGRQISTPFEEASNGGQHRAGSAPWLAPIPILRTLAAHRRGLLTIPSPPIWHGRAVFLDMVDELDCAAAVYQNVQQPFVRGVR